MKLYVYDHCPFCAKARMIFGLKSLPLELSFLARREQVDADDFVLYPSLRMLSIVKGVNYPANVKRYMARMEESTGVGLHFDQAC